MTELSHMSSTTNNPVLLLGGSGAVGSRAARSLRRLQPDLPIVIAARDATKAAAVAAGVGGSTTSTVVDLDREDLGLSPDAAFSGVVALLKDPALSSLKYAQARGVPYLSFSSYVFEIGPEVAHYVQKPTSAPILMLGHIFGGLATLAALHYAKELRKVDSIAIAGIVDPDDHGGPASKADFERLARDRPSALVREDGAWRWVRGPEGARRIVDAAGLEHQGEAIALVDVLSLAAATDARSLRVDFAARDAASRREGFSTEIIIEIAGERPDGTPAHVRHAIIDRDAFAGLSAHGAALATERLVGLDGGPPPAPGLYHPEVLLDPARVIERLKDLGVTVQRA